MTASGEELEAGWRRSLARHAEAAAGRRRTIDHQDVERLVEELAGRMLGELGRDRIAELRFRAIPRGGLIVLGQLAYALRLTADQVDPRADATGPLCLVDDCALSGRRVGEVLAAVDEDGPIVFGHLLSSSQLRAAIERADARVRCIAAEDLVDHAGGEGDDWERVWAERDAPGAKWRGLTDVIAFPWAEPDVALWDEVHGRVERGWRIASPDRCLKTRYELGAARSRLGPARLRVPDDVLHGTFDGALVLYRLADGALHQPSDAGALIWRMVARYGDEEAAVQGLVEAYGIDPEVAADDVARFVGELCGAGLLEPV